MLPVNFLTDKASEVFSRHDVREEDILAAIRFDLDTKGNFGETWLVLDRKRKRLCRADLSSDEYTEFELALLACPYIDNFNTSNALLAYRVKEPLSFSPEEEEHAFDDRCIAAASSGVTEIIGYCTNACKRRLFAFAHIWERFVRNEEVQEDDPIFDQFYAKCPKCGKVYEDQNRRICTNCVNRKGLMIRLLAYFKPFRLQTATAIICLALLSLIALLSPIINGQLLFDQVIDTTEPNVAYEYGQTLQYDPNGSLLYRASALSDVLLHKAYYYYTPDDEGDYLKVDGSYVYSSDSTVYRAEDGTYLDMRRYRLTDDGQAYLMTDDTGALLKTEKLSPEDTTRYRLVITDDRNESADAAQVTGRLHGKGNIYLVVALILLLALLTLGLQILADRSFDSMSNRVTKTMKNDIFRAMSALSLNYFNQNPTGRLITRVNYDAEKIKNFYVGNVPYLFTNILNLVGITIFLFTINVKLTLIVFLPIPIIVCMFKFMLPKLWRSYSRQWRRSSSHNAMLGDVLNGERVVKAFAKEAEETIRYHRYIDRVCEAELKTNLISLFLFPVVGLLIGMSSRVIWGFGGFRVMGGQMTYGQLTTYLGYLGMVFGPLNFLTNFTNVVTDTINSAQRMFEVLDMIPEIADTQKPVVMERVEGNVRFDRVCFHYSPNRPILNNVSFEIHAGDHVGLVGHTGSGKSTIANLITRMYDVISGSVYIDGVNVKDIQMNCLRRNIAIVSQEVFIFGGTIADNIRYAKPDATMEEIIRAAKAANAHDFIMRLPEGYETMVGIGSRSLSGGERQRISIARALLLSPSILILDEATAAMDNETERQISEAIDKLIVGRTTISIAHRLSTLKNCNYIMAIEHGEIAEMGSAEELLEKKGVYYKLYTLQNEQMQQVMQGL